MIGLLKIKALWIGLLLASPPLAAWMIQRPQAAPVVIQAGATVESTESVISRDELRIPVEVLAKGSTPETIYVEMRPAAVPEPGSLTLLVIPAFFLLRRRR